MIPRLLVAAVVAAVCLASIALVVWEHDDTAPAPPRSPPVGSGIVFDDDGNDVWRVRPDGSHLRRLTSDPAPEFDPSWSVDGEQIAYRSEVDGNAEIYVMDADGSHKRNLTRSPASDYSPTWSPTQELIAFASDRGGGTNDIYVMHADGSQVRRVTTNDAVDEYPSWSPDGALLAFATDRDDDWEIYVIGAGGSDERRLTRAGGKSPSWSPDGRLIAFQGPARGGGRSEHAELSSIWTIEPDGDAARFVASDAYTPAWREDGRAIVAGTAGALSLLDTNGHLRRRIAPGPALNADWRR